MDLAAICTQFQTIFATTDKPQIFFAPGRINLIGEHTDYNGGYVLPATISYGTHAIVRKRTDQTFRFYSINRKDSGIISCDNSDLSYQKLDDWANYPKGMIHYIKEAGHSIPHGLDISFYGNIPSNAGLSSSASLEIVTGLMLSSMYGLTIDPFLLAQHGQMVENHFMGVRSGLMDQMSIMMGKAMHAILLNCQNFTYEYVPIDFHAFEFIIINTNKRRSLTTSKYNERWHECKGALLALQKRLPITHLTQLTPETFNMHMQLITNPLYQKRAKHVIYENARIIRAAEELKNANFIKFGQLMNESHNSLKQNYEVTGIELDTIVETAQIQQGVLGARMTGAGFGGCAIALVKKQCTEIIKEKIQHTFRKKIGHDVTFYSANFQGVPQEMTKGVL